MFYRKIGSLFCLRELITLVPFVLSSTIVASAQNSLNISDTTYGILQCNNVSILETIRKCRAGVLNCSDKTQSHFADIHAQWGEYSWTNDLYFGLHGGLYISDQKEQDVFKSELKKISRFVQSENDSTEIVPYKVKSDGSSYGRNSESGLDYDRLAEFILDVVRVYEFTGDTEFLNEMYPVMVRIINWLGKQNRDDDILLEGRTLAAPITGVGSCVSVTYIGDAVKNDFKDFGASMFYFHALGRLALAETILGKSTEASVHLEKANRIREAINAVFWDSSIHGYTACINEKSEKNNNWITGNNAHAVYCGITDISQSKVITDFLNANKKEVIDVVPCRVSLDTFPAGYSSNPAHYYWNAGCWPLVSAPVMLAYRQVGDLESALHVMEVLSSDKVSKTRYGFFESYWSTSGKPNTCEGLLMNNGGVL